MPCRNVVDNIGIPVETAARPTHHALQSEASDTETAAAAAIVRGVFNREPSGRRLDEYNPGIAVAVDVAASIELSPELNAALFAERPGRKSERPGTAAYRNMDGAIDLPVHELARPDGSIRPDHR